MPLSSQTTSEELVAEAVHRLVLVVGPERIILFGSRARGEERTDPDVDLLVIASEKTIRQHGRRRLLARFWSAMGRLPASFDFFLFSPAEGTPWQSSINHLICRALREGKVLYERN